MNYMLQSSVIVNKSSKTAKHGKFAKINHALIMSSINFKTHLVTLVKLITKSLFRKLHIIQSIQIFKFYRSLFRTMARYPSYPANKYQHNHQNKNLN